MKSQQPDKLPHGQRILQFTEHGPSAVPRMVDCCMVEITVTSTAAGGPTGEVDISREPGTRKGASLRGARAADCAAVKIAPRIELCRRILSLFPLHPTW